MSRQHPRSVYVRRWLLLLAAAILVAWVIVQVWPFGAGGEPKPTSTTTVTALPSTAPPTPSAPASKAPVPAKPKPTPPPGITTRVTLAAGTAACKTRDVTISPSVTSPQFARRPVYVDVAITTTAKKPCAFTPKPLDPLAVVTQDDDTVWDSSICETAIVSRPVQLVPGWATTVRVPWVPRESGEACKPDEDWLKPDKYTLRVGTLGGEPGRADFTLAEPPPPPTPKPTPTASVSPAKPPPKPTVVKPTSAAPAR